MSTVKIVNWNIVNRQSLPVKIVNWQLASDKVPSIDNYTVSSSTMVGSSAQI